MTTPSGPGKGKVKLYIGLVVFLSVLAFALGSHLAIKTTPAAPPEPDLEAIMETANTDASTVSELQTGDFAEEVPTELPTGQ